MRDATSSVLSDGGEGMRSPDAFWADQKPVLSARDLDMELNVLSDLEGIRHYLTFNIKPTH